MRRVHATRAGAGTGTGGGGGLRAAPASRARAGGGLVGAVDDGGGVGRGRPDPGRTDRLAALAIAVQPRGGVPTGGPVVVVVLDVVVLDVVAPDVVEVVRDDVVLGGTVVVDGKSGG